VIDAVGNPLDGQGPINATEFRRVEMVAPGVIDAAAREGIDVHRDQGDRRHDPIGRGQRELIIGDRQIGKTAIGVDAIINQKDSGIFCIYGGRGQKKSTVAQVVEVLRRHGAMEYTTVVAACASDPATQQYIAPYSGCAIGEYYRDKGKHALIIYDDLSKQGGRLSAGFPASEKAARTGSLSGDIFYNHSRGFLKGPPN